MLDNTHNAHLSRLVETASFMLSSSDPESIFDKLCEATSRYGLDKIALGQAFFSHPALQEQPLFFFQKNIEEFLQIYAEENYQVSDPIALRALGTHRPFRWREAHIDLTPTQTKQLKVAESFGLCFGYVFPIIDRPGPVGFVSMGRETDFELNDLAFLELELLTRHAYYAIEKVHGRPQAPSKTNLTPREVTVLMHVANGKTNWEIGQILGISEYSVRDYLKSLSKRLQTSNHTHTVVKAIQLGLILP